MSHRSRSHSTSQVSVADGENQRSDVASRHSIVQNEMQVPAVDISMQQEGAGVVEA